MQVFNFIRILWFIIVLMAVDAYAADKVVDPLCGPKSLLKICEMKNITSDLKKICDLSSYNENSGTTMLGLYNAACKLGLPVVPVRINIEELSNINEPSIAFVDGNHFLVLHALKGNKVLIQNPPAPAYMQSKEVFKSRWNGEVLVFSDKLKKQMKSQLKSLSVPLKEPCVKFSQTSHNFSTVNEGEKLSNIFSFTNIGSEPLEVYARSTCTCAVAVTSKNRILSGDKGEIKVEFDTNGKKGQVKQTVFVKTNDPNNKYVTLTISADVKQSIKVVPDRILVEEMTVGEVIEREIQIIDSGNGTLKVMSVDTPEGVRVKNLPEENMSTKTIPMQLIIESGKVLGDFEKKIIIHTNDSKRSIITVPVTGKVIGNVKAFPAAFYFGEIKPDTTIIKEITLSSDKHAIKQLSAKSKSSFVKIEVVSIDGGHKYQLKAVLTSPHKESLIRDTIAVYLTDKDDPVLEIPLYALVTK
ncbi:DUF1573 domain-containing protein [bacterium]|nr:DUF1573 domain-containing protein [bacterium]